MRQDTNKEAKIEIGQEGVEAGDETPREGHHEVGCVMRLSSQSPPARDQQEVAMFRLDVFRVLEMTPGKLREGESTVDEGTVLFHTKPILL